MNSDIRIKIGFRRHPKTIRLERAVGAEAVLALIELWCWAAIYKPLGDLRGMDDKDIATAAAWAGDEAKFVEALQKTGWLDGKKLHDWHDHQGYVIHAPDRSRKAKKASQARWFNGHATSNARSNATSNAPSPDPDPDPDPSPPPKGGTGGKRPRVTGRRPGQDKRFSSDTSQKQETKPLSDPTILADVIARERKRNGL